MAWFAILLRKLLGEAQHFQLRRSGIVCIVRTRNRRIAHEFAVHPFAIHQK